MRNLRNQKGFTLIELMIVVVIIGILAALAIPRFSTASDRAKEKEADGILKQVYTLQMAYRAQEGGFATSFAELVDVGWEDPSASLRHYGLPAGVDLAAGVCMAPTGSAPTHRQRCIDIDGNITSP